jgi:hypothetical protein
VKTYEELAEECEELHQAVHDLATESARVDAVVAATLRTVRQWQTRLPDRLNIDVYTVYTVADWLTELREQLETIDHETMAGRAAAAAEDRRDR